MRHLVTRLGVFLLAVGLSGSAFAQQPSPDASAQPRAEQEARSPWLLAPMFSSSPKLGTALGGLGAYMAPLDRSIYPTIGAGVQFVIKPRERMNVNLEYAQGIDDNRGVYLKLGYRC